MKTLEQLRAFAEGYLAATYEPPSVDEWLEWGGYDLNITGADYAPNVGDEELQVNAYPERWEGDLPEPIHTFIV